MKFALLLLDEPEDSIVIGRSAGSNTFGKVHAFEKAWFSTLNELGLEAPETEIGSDYVPTEILTELLNIFTSTNPDVRPDGYQNRPPTTGDVIWLGGHMFEKTGEKWEYRGEMAESRIKFA